MQNPENNPYTPPPSMPQGGAPLQIPGADKKLPAGLCGILLGALGVHKFILGYTQAGIIMAAVSVLTCGFASPIMGIIGIIEGIIYLTKTDQQFVDEYIVHQKPWF